MLRIILQHDDFALGGNARALYVGHDPAKAAKAIDEALRAAVKADRACRITEVLDTTEHTVRKHDPQEAAVIAKAQAEADAKAKAEADAKAKAAAEHPDVLKQRIAALEKENAALKAE